MSVRTEDDGTVILIVDCDDDRKWHFDPDEARTLASALLDHADPPPRTAGPCTTAPTCSPTTNASGPPGPLDALARPSWLARS